VLEQKVHEIVEQKINLKEENKKYWDLDEEDE
jgi:hypothetical protein